MSLQVLTWYLASIHYTIILMCGGDDVEVGYCVHLSLASVTTSCILCCNYSCVRDWICKRVTYAHIQYLEFVTQACFIYSFKNLVAQLSHHSTNMRVFSIIVYSQMKLSFLQGCKIECMYKIKIPFHKSSHMCTCIMYGYNGIFCVCTIGI